MPSYQLNRETFAELRTDSVYFYGFGHEEAPWGAVFQFREVVQAIQKDHDWAAGTIELTLDTAGGSSMSVNCEGTGGRMFLMALREKIAVEEWGKR